MPHKLAKAKYPGTVDEKLCSKVGTYTWIQHQCPDNDIRILHLDGFSFSGHRHISYYTYRLIAFVLTMLLAYSLSISNKNLSTSAFGPCSNAFSAIFFDANTLSPYTAHPTSQRYSTAYMLLEYIGPNTGQMLSSTWEKHRNDPLRRQKLF
jgi:hypothetical protein